MRFGGFRSGGSRRAGACSCREKCRIKKNNKSLFMHRESTNQDERVVESKAHNLALNDVTAGDKPRPTVY